MAEAENRVGAVPARPVAGAPRVTVLLAVRNGQPFIESAVRSMMGQTFTDLEILVVDDCSTDDTPAVLSRLAAEDRRIRVERLPENLRLPRALNYGLERARGELIARMDADDVAEPERLAVQVRHLDAHPRTVLVAASYHNIDPEGRITDTWISPRDGYATSWVSRFHMPLVHPTFLFRARLPDGSAPRYDPAWTHSEDYDLVVRLLDHGDVDNLPDVLLRWRMHPGSISANSWAKFQEQGFAISERHCRATLPAAVVKGLEPVRAAFYEVDRPEPAAIFAGLRAMVAHDIERDPSRRRWVRRMAAHLARAALHRSRRSRQEVAAAFIGPGRDFLLSYGIRYLERKRVLPAMLWSDPDPRTTGSRAAA